MWPPPAARRCGTAALQSRIGYQVDLPHQVDVSVLHRVDVAGNQDCRVVDDDIQAAQPRNGLGDAALDTLQRTHVDGDRDRLAALGGDRLSDGVDGPREPRG